MKFLEAIVAFPSVVLEAVVGMFRQIGTEERNIIQHPELEKDDDPDA